MRTDDDARAAHYASLRDLLIGWGVRSWARAAIATGTSKVQAYYFTQVPPGLDSELLGAFHSAEIPYVFGNLLPPRPWREADRALSDAMMSQWINFATCGDPNGEGLPVWPAYDSAQDTAMTLGGTIATRSGVNRREWTSSTSPGTRSAAANCRCRSS